MKKILCIVSIALLVCGCNQSMKQRLGLVTPGPDEYQVHNVKPLDMPPHFDFLPPPDKKFDKKSSHKNHGVEKHDTKTQQTPQSNVKKNNSFLQFFKKTKKTKTHPTLPKNIQDKL